MVLKDISKKEKNFNSKDVFMSAKKNGLILLYWDFHIKEIIATDIEENQQLLIHEATDKV